MAIGGWPATTSGTWGTASAFSTSSNWSIDSTMLNSTVTSSVSQCAYDGHVIDSWDEYLDGVVVGYCHGCGSRTATRRLPGGMPFVRLKAVIEQLIADPDDLALVLELNELDELLQAESRSLEDARALLKTARRMTECET